MCDKEERVLAFISVQAKLLVSGRTKSGGTAAASTASSTVEATDREEHYNFYTDEEWQAFFDNVHPTTITENRMKTFFMIQLDGKLYPIIPTCTKLAYC